VPRSRPESVEPVCGGSYDDNRKTTNESGLTFEGDRVDRQGVRVRGDCVDRGVRGRCVV
jgi:hypothetical protein